MKNPTIEITGMGEQDALHTMWYHLRMAAMMFENAPLSFPIPDFGELWEPAIKAWVSAMKDSYND